MIQIKEIKQPPLLLALWKFSKFLSLQCLLYYWMIPFFPLGHFLSFNPSNNPLPENIKYLCHQALRLYKFSMKITKHCLERYAFFILHGSFEFFREKVLQTSLFQNSRGRVQVQNDVPNIWANIGKFISLRPKYGINELLYVYRDRQNFDWKDRSSKHLTSIDSLN